jgi:hypothetical protein
MNWALYAKWTNAKQQCQEKGLPRLLELVNDDKGERKYLVDEGVDHGANDYTEKLERHVPKELLLYMEFADKLVSELEA